MQTYPESLGDQPYDVIIVGGGAAGCVLAGRLSEDSRKRVLLMEAGPDVLPGKEHPDIRDPYPVAWSNSRFTWTNLKAEIVANANGESLKPARPYIQGYGLGGGSNINGMGADRAQPSDFDEWTAAGASGWSWPDVLPYFAKLEKDVEFAGPGHGTTGPIPIKRIPPGEWAPFARAVGRAAVKKGYPPIGDYNADFRDGLSAFPMSGTLLQRVSASMAYLPHSVRQRRNLTICTQIRVERISVKGRRADGVWARNSAGLQCLASRETIVACGALQTPALLMRSGIGPAQLLRSLGLSSVADLPAVGRNLQNHPALMLAAHLPRAAIQPASQRCLMQNVLRFSSGHGGCSEHDMLLYPFNRASWHPLGRRIGALVLYVNKAYSRGSVELASADTTLGPRIRFNLLADGRDLERMVDGARLMLELLGDPDVAAFRNEVFVPDHALAARFEKKTLANLAGAWTAARIMDIAPLRRRVLGNAVVRPDTLAASPAAIRALVLEGAQAAYHVCGTCRMGRPDDPQAVTDSAGRVLGLEGLRVGDASVFPTIPCANIHLTVLMAAEKLADHVKASWQGH